MLSFFLDNVSQIRTVTVSLNEQAKSLHPHLQMKEEEFTAFVRPLQRQMYALCLSILRDERDVADCLQEVYTRLWEHRHRLKDMENPAGYCSVAVRRAAIDMIRQRRRDLIHDIEDPPDIADTSPTPTDATETLDELHIVSTLLGNLPERQREILELSGISGLSNREIEEVTGLSGENVRVLLSRGRKRLKELFDKIR